MAGLLQNQRTLLFRICSRLAHKDYHAPDWDFKHHRVKNLYEPDKSWQMEFAQQNTRKERWNYYNQVVWRPGYKYDDGAPKAAEVFFVAENIKHSPLKLWYVFYLIRGKSVGEAMKQLDYLPRKGAIIVNDLLKQAVEKAVTEHSVEYRSNLWIADAFAEKSVVVKGLRRHARERWGRVEYVFSNVYIRLEEGQPPKTVRRPESSMKPEDLANRYVNELRSRRIIFGQ